jgi:hypothetical protein
MEEAKENTCIQKTKKDYYVLTFTRTNEVIVYKTKGY